MAPISGEKKSHVRHDRRRGGRERDQDRPRLYRPSDIIASSGAFHGRTLLTMAMTGKVVPYKTKFGPFPAGHLARAVPGRARASRVEDTLHAIEWLFKSDVEPSRVAAIIIEPVQGEGGFYVAPKEFMQAPAQAVRRARHRAHRR